jgi:hypothetical protein
MNELSFINQLENYHMSSNKSNLFGKKQGFSSDESWEREVPTGASPKDRGNNVISTKKRSIRP